MKKVISMLIKIGVSGVILYFLFRSINMAAFLKTVTSINPLLVALAALVFLACQCVSTYRWSVILKKDMDIPYRKLFSIYFIGMFFNNFLPTMVGGDIVKGYYLYKYSKRGDVSMASIFMDRYSGFTALMLIAAIALFLGYGLIKGTGLPAFLALLIGGFVFASLIIWVSFLHGWVMVILSKIHFYGINEKIDTFYRILMSYRHDYAALWKIFLFSMLVQVGGIIGYYIIGTGLGMNLHPLYYFLFVPLTATIAMLPISLAGLGIREGAFVFLFTRAGATTEQALTLSLMWFVVTVIVSLIGGVEYIRMGGKGPSTDGYSAENNPS